MTKKYKELVKDAENDMFIKNVITSAKAENTYSALMLINSHKDYIRSLVVNERMNHRFRLVIEYFERKLGGKVNEGQLLWPLFKIGIFHNKILAIAGAFGTLAIHTLICFLMCEFFVLLEMMPDDYALSLVIIVFIPIWIILVVLSALLFTSRFVPWKEKDE